MPNASHSLYTALLAACFCTVGPTTAHATPYLPDSVGIERKDGKRFIIHRVDQGQTLFAVGRRYGVSTDAIRKANPDLSDGGVRYDQLLRVPVPDVTLSRREQKDVEKSIRREEKEKVKATKETERLMADVDADAKADAKAKRRDERREEKFTKENDGVHVVTTGQTLYSLAVRYNVTMADLRAWNNLGADGIQVGQTLLVSAKAAAAKGMARADEPRADPRPATGKARPTNDLASRTATKPEAEAVPAKIESKSLVAPEPPLAPGSKPKAKAATTTPVPEHPAKTAEPKKIAEPKKEKEEAEPKKTTEPTRKADPAEATGAKAARVQADIGFADVIEGNDASTKYLALHRSAPVGTLVQVRNDINNQSLYVKVVGKLPDTGINDQVLIRLSARAFEKLSPNGQRFRAEVSYTK